MNEDSDSYGDVPEDDMGEEPEEGEIEDDDEVTELAEEQEERNPFMAGDLNTYGGNDDASDEDDGDGQPMREVIVVGSGDQTVGAANSKRGYAESSDLVDPDKKRRKA